VILICFVRFSPVFDHGTERSLNKHAAGDDADGNNGWHGMSPSPAAAFDVCVRDPVTLTWPRRTDGWSKVQRPTRHKTSHFGDGLPSQSLGSVVKKISTNSIELSGRKLQTRVLDGRTDGQNTACNQSSHAWESVRIMIGYNTYKIATSPIIYTFFTNSRTRQKRVIFVMAWSHGAAPHQSVSQ